MMRKMRRMLKGKDPRDFLKLLLPYPEHMTDPSDPPLISIQMPLHPHPCIPDHLVLSKLLQPTPCTARRRSKKNKKNEGYSVPGEPRRTRCTAACETWPPSRQTSSEHSDQRSSFFATASKKLRVLRNQHLCCSHPTARCTLTPDTRPPNGSTAISVRSNVAR